MKGFIIFIMAYSLSAMATFDTFLVNSFNVDYAQQEGAVSVQRFYFPALDIDWTNPESLVLRKDQDTFVLALGRREFFLPQIPQFLLAQEKILIEKLNFDAKESELNADVEKVFLHTQRDDYYVDKLKAQCFEGVDNNNFNFINQALEGCTTQSQIEFKRVYLVQRSPDEKIERSRLFNFFNSINASTTMNEKSQSVAITNARVRISEHSFSFKGRVESGVSGNATMKGMTWYLFDTNQVLVRLDEAHFGWFNIRNEIFKQIESDQSGRFEVDRPYIYININKL